MHLLLKHSIKARISWTLERHKLLILLMTDTEQQASSTKRQSHNCLRQVLNECRPMLIITTWYTVEIMTPNGNTVLPRRWIWPLVLTLTIYIICLLTVLHKKHLTWYYLELSTIVHHSAIYYHQRMRTFLSGASLQFQKVFYQRLTANYIMAQWATRCRNVHLVYIMFIPEMY
jgi:hypothetical protein